MERQPNYDIDPNDPFYREVSPDPRYQDLLGDHRVFNSQKYGRGILTLVRLGHSPPYVEVLHDIFDLTTRYVRDEILLLQPNK